jgi:hypothetical protein
MLKSSAEKLGHVNSLDILITNAFIDAAPPVCQAINHFKGDELYYPPRTLGFQNSMECFW